VGSELRVVLSAVPHQLPQLRFGVVGIDGYHVESSTLVAGVLDHPAEVADHQETQFFEFVHLVSLLL
jgi:hypothetical protein